MEFFKCPGCRVKFDTGAKAPWLLTKCGHHLCAECVGPTPKQIVCSQDGIVSEAVPVDSKAKSQSLEPGGHGCAAHNRKYEFFCLNDETEICSLCGLFGEHKGHQIIVQKELEEVTRKLIAEIDAERARVQLTDELRKGETFQAIFERKVVDGLKNCRKQVDALYQKIKNSLKKQFASHFERIEKEIRDFLKTGRVQVTDFEHFASSCVLLDSEMTEQKRRFENAVDDYSGAYLRFKKIKESLLELRPTTEVVEGLMKTVLKIKLPIKFEVTPHNLNIHLLDSSFVPTLRETLLRYAVGGSASKPESEGSNSLNLRKSRTERLSAMNGNGGEAGVPLNEKFNVKTSSRSRTRIQGFLPTDPGDGQLPTSQSSKVLFRPMAKQPSGNEEQVVESDVNLYNFRNIYENKVRPPALGSQRMSSLLKQPARDNVSPNRKSHISSSQVKEPLTSTGNYGSLKAKVLDKTLVRRSSFNDLKFSTRYQKNVISIEDDLGLVTNQFVDEAKLRNIICSFKTVSKNVRRIEMVNNTFVCNPVLVFKAAITERSHCQILVDLHQNKVLCGLTHNKRDVDALKSLNVEILT